MPYNILTCNGFGEAIASSGIAGIGSGDCIKARLGLVMLFFIIAIVRRWGGEEIGLNYNFWISLLCGLILYFIIVTFTGSFKIAMGIGLVGALVGGYGGGIMFGGEE